MTKRKAGDGEPPPRMLLWMTAVRDHPDRPPPKQFHVLTCLVLRMDWRTGKGHASTAQLAADADCGKDTVQRSTTWARKHHLADRTKRGHALRDGSGMASEWQLRSPEPGLEGGTGDPFQDQAGRLEGRKRRLEGRKRRLEGRSTDPPSIPNPSRPNSSSARGPSADIIRAVYPDATDDEIEAITKDRTRRGARSAEAVLAHEVRQGILRLPCNPGGPGHYGNGCRDGDPRDCAVAWCACRCHTKPSSEDR